MVGCRRKTESVTWSQNWEGLLKQSYECTLTACARLCVIPHTPVWGNRKNGTLPKSRKKKGTLRWWELFSKLTPCHTLRPDDLISNPVLSHCQSFSCFTLFSCLEFVKHLFHLVIKYDFFSNHFWDSSWDKSISTANLKLSNKCAVFIPMFFDHYCCNSYSSC